MTKRQSQKLNKEVFNTWLTDPVTKLIFTQLTEVRETIESGLKDESIILSDGGQLKLARLLGQRDGIDAILNIKYDDGGFDNE